MEGFPAVASEIGVRAGLIAPFWIADSLTSHALSVGEEVMPDHSDNQFSAQTLRMQPSRSWFVAGPVAMA